jgi:hypothetical protein
MALQQGRPTLRGASHAAAMVILALSIIIGATFTQAVVMDSPYFQDVSHRALFKNQPPIANFESLPFAVNPSLTSQAMVYVEASDCFAVISENVVYTAVEKHSAGET